MLSRRQVLTFLAALGLPLRLRGQGPSAGPGFPFAKDLVPLKPGEARFPKGGYLPSFLHPNGTWVMLSSNTGAQVLWDWRKGVPVVAWGGAGSASRGDLPEEPCGNEVPRLGAFAPGGGHWIFQWSWSGGDDGWKTMVLQADGVTQTIEPWMEGWLQVDLLRPRVHFGVPAEGGAGWFVRSLDLGSGASKDGALLPAGRGMDVWSDATVLSADGAWLLRFDPDERPGAGGGQEAGWWSVWSTADGRCRTFRKGVWPKESQGIGFSLDGRRAFVPEPWDWSGQRATGDAPVPTVRREDRGPSEVLADQGRFRLVRVSESRIEVREAATNRLVRRLAGILPNARLVAFGPSRDLAVVAQSGGPARLWNRGAKPWRVRDNDITGEPMMRPPFSLVGEQTRSVFWTRQGRRLGHGSEGGVITLRDGAALRYPRGNAKDELDPGGTLWSTLALGAPVRGLAWGGGWVGGLGGDGRLALLDAAGGAVLRGWRAHSHRANDLVASGDGAYLISGGLDGLALWHAADGALVRRFAQKLGEVTALALHPRKDQTLLAATFLSGAVGLFDWTSGTLLWEVQAFDEAGASVAFHPDGLSLWCSGMGAGCAVFEVSSGARPKPNVPGFSEDRGAGGTGNLQTVAWSWDGKSYAVGNAFEDVEPWPRGGLDTSLDFAWDWECT